MAQHIESLPVPDFEDEPHSDLIPQPHGGALQRGNVRHGLGFRNDVTPAIRRRSEEVRQWLADEFPGSEFLALPTVELFCQETSRAILYGNLVEEYAAGKSRRVGGKMVSGIEACPRHIMEQATRSALAAAKLAQDLGLDITGRVKANKDDAIRRTLERGNDLTSFASEGRKLRQLRGRAS